MERKDAGGKLKGDTIKKIGLIKANMRAPIKYLGGKGNLLKKILPLVPSGGRPYCEPFFGGGWVFFARDPAPVEVINDIDGSLINLFRVLQDEELFPKLKHKLLYTLYSRAEFARAIQILEDENNVDPVDKAWAKFVVHNQGMSGTSSVKEGSWGRSFRSNRGIAQAVNGWIMRLTMLDDWHKRLLMAQIDCRDALEVIQYWDNPDAVFYLDPPYHLEAVFDMSRGYKYKLSNEQHEQLIDVVLRCKGSVTLSGYMHPTYEILEKQGWKLFTYQTVCYAAGKVRGSGLQGSGSALKKVPRTECVWVNLRAQQVLDNLSFEHRHEHPQVASLF